MGSQAVCATLQPSLEIQGGWLQILIVLVTSGSLGPFLYLKESIDGMGPCYVSREEGT